MESSLDEIIDLWSMRIYLFSKLTSICLFNLYDKVWIDSFTFYNSSVSIFSKCFGINLSIYFLALFAVYIAIESYPFCKLLFIAISELETQLVASSY